MVMSVDVVKVLRHTRGVLSGERRGVSLNERGKKNHKQYILIKYCHRLETIEAYN